MPRTKGKDDSWSAGNLSAVFSALDLIDNAYPGTAIQVAAGDLPITKLAADATRLYDPGVVGGSAKTGPRGVEVSMYMGLSTVFHQREIETAIHEFGHVLDIRRGWMTLSSSSPGWLDASGWSKAADGSWSISAMGKYGMVSNYPYFPKITPPVEDFAESFFAMVLTKNNRTMSFYIGGHNRYNPRGFVGAARAAWINSKL